MIYITGDTHADFSRFEENKFPIQSEMTKNDYIIICGDFGGVCNYIVESIYEKHWLDWLNNKNLQLYLLMVIMKILKDYIIIQWKNGMVVKFIK